MKVGHRVVNKEGKEGVVKYILNGPGQVVVSYNGIEAVEQTTNLIIKEERIIERFYVYKKNGRTV